MKNSQKSVPTASRYVPPPVRTVYITDPVMSLSYANGHIRFSRHGKMQARLPMIRVRQLIIMEKVGISSRLLAECLRYDVPVFFMKAGGDALGSLTGRARRDPMIRIRQLRAFDDFRLKHSIAAHLVTAKLTCLRQILRKHSYNYPQQVKVKEVAHRLGKNLDKIERTNTLDELRGIEGIASREYFAAYGDMLRNNFKFIGRNRRPPRDPVNAMLSLGYTILTQEAASLVDAAGLDPAVGFLHEPAANRPSLALDLLEPFRPLVIDRLVLSLVNLKQLTPEDFEVRPGREAVLLKNEARKKFFTAYEEYIANCPSRRNGEIISSLREALENQIESFAHAMRHDAVVNWRPYSLTEQTNA